MPLNLVGLKADLEALFTEPGDTAVACAATWADAMQAYASAIVPPSTTVATAAATLSGALAAAFVQPPASVIANVEAAFLAFGAAVAVGMAPTFTGVPPAVPVGFAAEFAKPPSEWAATHAAAATLWGDKIHAWMTTGTAVLVAPPNPVTIWS